MVITAKSQLENGVDVACSCAFKLYNVEYKILRSVIDYTGTDNNLQMDDRTVKDN